MNIEQIYSSWLKASMIEGRTPLLVNIQRAYLHTFKDQNSGDEKQQICIDVGEASDLPLNVTNARAIASLHGSDTDHWVGRPIALLTMREEAFGKIHDVIRIDDPRRYAAPQAPVAPQQQQPAPQAPVAPQESLMGNMGQSFDQRFTQPAQPAPQAPGTAYAPPPAQQPQPMNDLPPSDADTDGIPF